MTGGSCPGPGSGVGDEPEGGEALEVARSFVAAIAWGEHRRVWELLGSEGRRTVLRVAGDRGMDKALVARLRDGTAAEREQEQFLADLVNGLRADLRGADLDGLAYWTDPGAPEPARTWVVMMTPLAAELGGDVPVGTLELSQDDGHWRVERLIPRPGR